MRLLLTATHFNFRCELINSMYTVYVCMPRKENTHLHAHLSGEDFYHNVYVSPVSVFLIDVAHFHTYSMWAFCVLCEMSFLMLKIVYKTINLGGHSFLIKSFICLSYSLGIKKKLRANDF